MFNLNDSMRYYLYPYPTDMRKSFYTLSGVVKDLMGQDVRNGDVFIFIGRTCSSVKILHMECGGLVIYHLRLEEGQFKLSVFDERPANTFWSKALVRIDRRFLSHHISQYYESIYQIIQNRIYDYVFVVNIEAMPISFLERVRKINPQAVFILYMWDSISNKRNTVNYLSLFDRIFSFDRDDCKIYANIRFRPLFFLNEYKELANVSDYEYDFSFVGTAHSDRYALIRKIYVQICNLCMKSYWHLYLQDKKLFYWNKITNSAFLKAHLHDFQYRALLKSEVLDLVKKSRIIIDIQHPRQVGLTMRTIEILGARRKLITTVVKKDGPLLQDMY